ncbi:MAG: hypothetical protein WC421_01550 [Elusimicrobiales bacterium]
MNLVIAGDDSFAFLPLLQRPQRFTQPGQLSALVFDSGRKVGQFQLACLQRGIKFMESFVHVRHFQFHSRYLVADTAFGGYYLRVNHRHQLLYAFVGYAIAQVAYHGGVQLVLRHKTMAAHLFAPLEIIQAGVVKKLPGFCGNAYHLRPAMFAENHAA